MEKALEYANLHREKHLNDLFKLLAQPSVSAQKWGIEECANLLSTQLKEVGFQVDIFPLSNGYPVVYGELMVGAPLTLIFYNHYDVQPVEPLNEWHSDPFKPEIREGKIYARGVSDNKGNIMSRLKGVESYLKGEGSLPVNIKWVIEGEEEIGSTCLREFIEAYKDKLEGVGIIWESGGKDSQGKPVISFGCKGILYAELIARKAERDLHSAYAAVVESPVWHLIEALRCLKDVSSDKILIPGFYDEVKEPTPEELALMVKYPLEEDELKKSMGIKEFIGGLTGLELHKKLLYEPTCNICGIISGYTGPGSKTVLPKEASAKIDFRLVPNQKVEELFIKMKKHLLDHGFGDIEVIPHGLEDPAQGPINSLLKEVVEKTAYETWKVEPILRPRMAGTGPMAMFYEKLPLPMMDGVGVAHHLSSVHAPNENCYEEDYYKTIDWVIRIISSLGKN